MLVDILYSSSRGNCTLIRDGETAILIDCGKNYKALSNALEPLGLTASDIDAVFITHEHSDHISALDVLCGKTEVPVHMTEKSSKKIKVINRAFNCLKLHIEEYIANVGSLKVESFPLPHDSLDHVGYIVESAEDGDTVGVATDIGHVTPKAEKMLSRCRRVFIESNHDIEMLQNGPYPRELKRRILSPVGHLSNEACGIFACRLADKGCRCFVLGHLSEENNDPELAYSEVRRALDSSGHTDVLLEIADRDCSVHMPDLEPAAVN